MKVTLFYMLLIAVTASCDFRSGTAKKNMEKYVSSPTPAISPAPAESPVDPADVINGDVALDGKLVNVNAYDQTKTATCDEFNRLMVNGDRNTVMIKGACRQIMVNGDGNQITADGAVGFVLNGTENVVRYSRFVNGKRPTMTENRAGNTVEKVSTDATSTPPSQKKAK